jgi:hypothetical protein
VLSKCFPLLPSPSWPVRSLGNLPEMNSVFGVEGVGMNVRQAARAGSSTKGVRNLLRGIRALDLIPARCRAPVTGGTCELGLFELRVNIAILAVGGRHLLLGQAFERSSRFDALATDSSARRYDGGVNVHFQNARSSHATVARRMRYFRAEWHSRKRPDRAGDVRSNRFLFSMSTSRL